MRFSNSGVIAAILVATILLSVGCKNQSAPQKQSPSPSPSQVANINGSDTEPGAAQPPEPGDASPEDFEGTAGIVEKRKDNIGPVTLREVRAARHPGYDRVVFEFEGGDIPGYHLEYIDRPVRQCGSGKAVPVAGDGWLRVRLTPAQAHTESGEATVKERERHLDLPVLKELESICDFEGQVAWVLGLSSPNRYRVLELSNPPRLVVDVKH